MVRVKICGVKRPEDARAAAQAGAHAIGLNFVAESPRCIGYASGARRLIVQSGAHAGMLWAGVFANLSESEIEKIVADAGLQIVQLHGDESPEFAQRLRKRLGPAVHIWKAFRVSSADDLVHCGEFEACDAFVLDAKALGVRGGSGQSFDWDLLRGVVRKRPWVLAGGLNPDNVQEAVKRVAPEWVDVASGVEESPGKKDRHKLEVFLSKAKSALVRIK